MLVGLAREHTRAAVSRVIAEQGYDVVCAADGCHLIQQLSSAILGDDDARPGLIVTNPILVGCTGLSVLAGLRDLGWDTPVIFVSAEGDEVGRSWALAHGATGVFSEPVDPGELATFVNIVLSPEIGARFGVLGAPEGTRPG